MSDRHSSHDAWLSKLRNHLAEERYAARTSRQCITVGRHFFNISTNTMLTSAKRKQQASRRICNRHGGRIVAAMATHQITKVGGVSTPMASHMLLRLAQGQWPPVPRAVTPAEIWRSEILGEYAQWMAGQRGLGQGTVSHRCSEAGRFLDWLGEQASREELTTLTHFDADR